MLCPRGGACSNSWNGEIVDGPDLVGPLQNTVDAAAGYLVSRYEVIRFFVHSPDLGLHSLNLGPRFLHLSLHLLYLALG